MLVLDTDHLTEYQRGTSAEARRLKERLDHKSRSGQNGTVVRATPPRCLPVDVLHALMSVQYVVAPSLRAARFFGSRQCHSGQDIYTLADGEPVREP